jgi:hypothetical protein
MKERKENSEDFACYPTTIENHHEDTKNTKKGKNKDEG